MNEENKKENKNQVKGRVFLYDDSTKTLILKIWSDRLQSYIGLGMYNAKNVELVRIHVLQDADDSEFFDVSDFGEERDPCILDDQTMTEEFTCSDDSYNKIIMDKKEKFCREQTEKRKKELDEKYGQIKTASIVSNITQSQISKTAEKLNKKK